MPICIFVADLTVTPPILLEANRRAELVYGYTAAEFAGIPLKNATVAIHGFGNVGTFAYQYLTEKGAKIIALADKNGNVFSKDGFDRKVITKAIKEKLPLADVFPKQKVI